jgi:hypothetical protein
MDANAYADYRAAVRETACTAHDAAIRFGRTARRSADRSPLSPATGRAGGGHRILTAPAAARARRCRARRHRAHRHVSIYEVTAPKRVQCRVRSASCMCGVLWGVCNNQCNVQHLRVSMYSREEKA